MFHTTELIKQGKEVKCCEADSAFNRWDHQMTSTNHDTLQLVKYSPPTPDEFSLTETVDEMQP